jgi:hypothetical protein
MNGPVHAQMTNQKKNISVFPKRSYSIQLSLAHLRHDVLDKFETDQDAVKLRKAASFFSVEDIHNCNAYSRVSHTLKRIKEKGYYSNSVKSLIDVIHAAQNSDGQRGMLSSFMDSIFEWGWRVPIRATPISDDDWYRGIELCMILRKSDVVMDKETTTYAPYIDECIDEIRTYVVFMHAISVFENMKAAFDLQGKEKLSLLQALEEEYKNLRASLKRREELLRHKEAKHQEALQDNNLQHKKELRRLFHEHNQALRAKDAEIRKLQKEIDALKANQSMTKEGGAAETGDSAIPAQPNESIRLPKKNVIFLGGHSNLHGKLSAKYPEWVFINDDNYKSNKPCPSTEIVFFWTNHISHRLQENVFSNLPEGVEVIYVTATNINRLEAEMIDGYSKYLQRKIRPEGNTSDREGVL